MQIPSNDHSSGRDVSQYDSNSRKTMAHGINDTLPDKVNRIVRKFSRNAIGNQISPSAVSSETNAQEGRRKQTFSIDNYNAVNNAGPDGYIAPHGARTLGEIIKDNTRKK